MYRTYEDPKNLEALLEQMKAEYQQRYEAGEPLEDLIDLAESIEEMKQRINFAWQDDEYDSDYCSGEWED